LQGFNLELVKLEVNFKQVELVMEDWLQVLVMEG
jgi:hypothetical protein